jgi:multidrug efflux pump subunit AcrB
VVPGQLSTPEEFGEVVLRSNSDGSTVRLKDVARIELGIESYAFESRLDGKPAVAMAVQLTRPPTPWRRPSWSRPRWRRWSPSCLPA